LPPTTLSPREAALDRRLGPIDAAAIVVSNVIGGGIFLAPPLIAQFVPNPIGMLSVWLAGGLLAFTGAMAYAELAALRPRAGGEYVYLRDAFGPLAAFLTGWTSFVAGFSGAIASNSVFLASVLGRFIPPAQDTTPFFSVEIPFVNLAIASSKPLALVVSPNTIVALSVLAVLTLIHVAGLGPGRIVQNLLAGAKVAALVVFVLLGFALGRGSFANVNATGDMPAIPWLLALVLVMFAYSGWNAAAYVAEEVRSPGRNVPLALGLGTAAVIVIYLALNLLYVYAIPVSELAKVQGGVLDTTAERLFGFVAANLLAAFTIVSVAASISAMVLAGPRVYFAMARDGLFLRTAARVHPRFKTPAIAIVAQSIWSAILILSGTLVELVSYTGFAVILFAGIAVAALFVLRYREPHADRPFRALGYPVAPAVFVAACTILVVNQVWRDPRTSLAGLAIISAGIPVYLIFARRARGSTAAPTT
jgi:APA family basic amino acid/polyamine antiporter